MATWTDEANGIIGVIGNASKTGAEIRDAWKNTNKVDSSGSDAKLSNSLDSLASSIANQANANRKYLIMGGVALVAIIGAVFIFKK